MRWFAHLYAGEYAEANGSAILKGLIEGRNMPSVYVITRAIDSDGILDIYKNSEFRRERIQEKDPLVIGIAMSRREAFELTRRIVDDLYRSDGGFDIDAFCNSQYS